MVCSFATFDITAKTRRHRKNIVALQQNHRAEVPDYFHGISLEVDVGLHSRWLLL